MKKLFTLSLFLAMAVCVLAQAPQKMSYQAVIRNNSGQLVASHAVGMRISILQASPTGTPVYVETQTVTTNVNGLATIEIGGGSVVSGSFSGINWASGTYFVKTETDPAGGTSYTITGTSPLLSVPYSLFSKSAGNGSLWTQNGSNIYYNTGYVGIGTNAPAGFLNLSGNSNTNLPHLLLSETEGDYARLSFKNTAATAKNWSIAGRPDPTDANSLLNFWYWNGTTGQDLMSIKGNGDVGIGTTAPAAFLNVFGNCDLNHPLLLLTENQDDYARMMFKSAAFTSKNWTISGGFFAADENSRLNFHYHNGTSGKDLMSIRGNGNVGIGTAIPGRLLHIYGAANPRILVESPDQAPELNLQRGSTTHALYVNGNYDLAFYCSGDRMALTHDGKLGVGTTAPAAFLNVFGNCDVNHPLLLLTENQWDYARLMFKSTAVPNNNWTIAASPDASDDNSFMNFYYNNGTIGNDIMTVVGNGRVGILTKTPNYTLDVRGTIGNNTTLYHSDLRWKKDIQQIKYGVSELMKLNSVSYLWNTNDYPDMGFDIETQFGFIAQEFEKVIPELVRTDKDGFKSIDYVKLTPVLVEAIKEQQKQIDELKYIVNELSAKLSVKIE